MDLIRINLVNPVTFHTCVMLIAESYASKIMILFSNLDQLFKIVITHKFPLQFLKIAYGFCLDYFILV